MSGQFTQQDPIGLAGGLNLYGFAGGDPINFWDPFGLCKDANGNDLPPDQCRSVTAAEGQSIRTGDFAGSNDFVSVAAGDAQGGDIVVQGGYAGVFTGTYSNGFPVVLQNGTRGVQAITFGVNADGTGRNGLDAVQPTFYRRQVPINP